MKDENDVGALAGNVDYLKDPVEFDEY